MSIALGFIKPFSGDLINAYSKVKLNPHELIRRLQDLPVDKETYERLRSWLPSQQIDRAVRFLYLNRTAFSGMYRLNQQGLFNVPFGGGQRTPEALWNEGLLMNASKMLKAVELRTGDFQESLNEAGPGDLVYCDPTYTVAHNNNGFVRYNERNFSWQDQKRLAETCQRLATAGATVVVSNADHYDVRKLYPRSKVYRLCRPSSLCPDAKKRRSTTELLFMFDQCRVIS